MRSTEGNLNPLGYRVLTPTTAKGLSDSADPAVGGGTGIPSGSRVVLLKAESQPVRWRDDGTNPTASQGMLLDAGEEFLYTGKPSKLKFIDTAAGASTLHANFYS